MLGGGMSKSPYEWLQPGKYFIRDVVHHEVAQAPQVERPRFVTNTDRYCHNTANLHLHFRLIRNVRGRERLLGDYCAVLSKIADVPAGIHGHASAQHEAPGRIQANEHRNELS